MAQLVDLKVGFSCNNNCIHCVISDKVHEKELSLDEIKELIEQYQSKVNMSNKMGETLRISNAN